MKNLLIICTTAIALMAVAQDRPIDIPKKDLPAEAECVTCTINATGHGKEKPAGGVMFKGTPYYFCNSAEIKAFKADPESHLPPVLPRPAPAFNIKALDGALWNADTMKGKLVLIDFWATWCKPCIEMMPSIDKVREKYHAQGFEVLSVSIDEKRADLDKFLKKRKFVNPVLHDTEQTWEAWGVRAIPATFLVKDGKIVMQWRGKVDEKALTAAVEAHLKK